MPKVFYRKQEWYTELMSVVEQFSDHFLDVESTKFVESWRLTTIICGPHGPIDEEALFNNPDPYGMKELEAMEEGEDDTDTAPPPLVNRRANLPTLEVEAYIDLKAPKLKERFAPDQGKSGQPTSQPAPQPPKQSSSKWTEEDAEWDPTDWA
ncbi:hypothetical protein B0H11DRAFT_2222024 [Mycena galericulata]|nr:hypothetical protein B0H11DRAFT_2222024 [Mycena galericulata]